MSEISASLSLERKACFDATLTLTSGTSGDPYNLSGVTITGRITRNFDGALQSIVRNEILVPESGVFRLYLEEEDTTNLDLAPSHWDVFIQKTGDCPIRLISGPVYISGDNWL